MTAAEKERLIESATRAAMEHPPLEPYRGLEPFRFADAGVLAAREGETQRLVRLVTMYRGVLLYGESGSGKSSIVNAGLLPRLVEEGMWPHRIRVQPRVDAEFVLEPIRWSSAEPKAHLPSAFGGNVDAGLVLSARAFPAAVEEATAQGRILLVFDQFEELATLFHESSEDRASRSRIVDSILRLLRGALPVKLLFVFREDYLANLEPLLAEQPELTDQSLRLVAPPTSTAPEIIRAPFERFSYDRELSDELAERISRSFAARNAAHLNLSELQIVCQSLWRTKDPAALLRSRGVEGLLEDFLTERLAAFEGDSRDLAVVLLTRLVTSSGTRNVVSGADLIADAVREKQCDAQLVAATITRLVEETGLIREERRRDVTTFEIVSEFLVPMIVRLKAARTAKAEAEQALAEAAELHRQELARRRKLTAGAVALALVVVIVGGLAAYAWRQRGSAISQARAAAAHELAQSADGAAHTDKRLAVTLALRALRKQWVPEGENTLRAAVAAIGPPSSVRKLGQGSRWSGAFSHDGRFVIATGSGRVRIWNATTGATVRPRAHPPFGGVPAAVDPTRNGILVNGPKATLLEYNALAPTAAPRRYIGPTANSAVFSPDGSLIASPGAGGYVYLWRSGDAHWTSRIAVGHIPSGGTQFSSDSRSLLTLNTEGRVAAWALPSGRLRWQEDRVSQGGPISRAAFSPDGRLVATLGEAAGSPNRPQIRIWKARRGSLVGTIRLHKKVDDFELSPDNLLLAATGPGRTVLWDARTGIRLARLSFGGRNVAFSPGGQKVLVFGREGGVRIWNFRKVDGVFPTVLHAYPAARTAISPTGKIVATASEHGTLKIWTLPGGRNRYTVRLPRNRLNMVAFNPSGSNLAVATQTGADKIYSTSSRRLLRTLPAGGDTKSVAYSRDGREIATAGGKTVRIWDAKTGRLLQKFVAGHPLEDAVFNEDGSRVAAGSVDGRVRIWDLRTRKLVKLPRKPLRYNGRWDRVYAVAYDPTGGYLAAGTASGRIVVWDRTNETRVATLLGDSGPVRVVAFESDGRHLLSAGGHRRVRLWDWRTALGAVVAFGITRATSVDLSRDGRWLTYAGPQKTVFVTHCGACLPLKGLKRLAGFEARPLTPAEQQTFLHSGERTSKPY